MLVPVYNFWGMIMFGTLLAGVSAAAVIALAPVASAESAPGAVGLQAAEQLAQQLVTAARAAEAAAQGSGKIADNRLCRADVAIEADIEAAVLAQIRDSSASPDVVAKALTIARQTRGLDCAIEGALGHALQLALGAQTPGPGAVGRPGGAAPLGPDIGGGGGGGGSGYRTR